MLAHLEHHCAVVGSHRLGRIGAIAFDFPARALLLRVLPEQIVLILIERGVAGDERVHCVVVDFVGLKLLVDPVVETDGAHFLHVTRPGAEAEPAQSLDDLLVGRQLADIGPRYNGFRRRFGTRSLRGCANWGDTQ